MSLKGSMSDCFGEMRLPGRLRKADASPFRGFGMTISVYALPKWGLACRTPTRAAESIFAFEDEIGQREQGSRIFGIAVPIEASLGAACVNEGQAAGAIERAGIANQRDKLFRLHGMKFLFFEHTRHEFARFAVAVFHGVNQRQGDLPLFQITEDGLAELFAGSGEVQKIIH